MQNTVIIYNSNKQLDIKALPVLGGCLLLSAAVCAAQILGNLAVLLLCLLGYLVFTIWACNKGVVFPVLLYFLPWSPLFKMYNGGISFFTIVLLLCCMVSLLQNKMSLRLYQIILAALLMALTLVTKAMQGIRQLVDSVGGVTVTPDASFSGFTAGQPVTLTGQRTENYIRYRADSTEGNNQRMQRQKQVVLALVNKMLAQVKEDPASVLALYNDVRRNITTNINTAMMVYLAQQASGMHFSGDIVNVPGTSVMGAQKHAEYQVDPDALLEMVLDIFYEPVDG